ncbi:MAG: TrkA family potassium uptake protein [Spirochaetes bacterium]|nr:TrkA family potassium uptake protein [Spirochaetota bacterium]MBU1079751.1 TrkA family potassium uptake protein [Spirochaetota bacterium]
MPQTRTFAVIGLGSFGSRVCEVLSEKGASVVAIDADPAALERVKGIVSAAVLVDTTDEGALLKAPLDGVDVAIVAIGDNLEASILTTALLKQRGVPYVAARAITSIHETVLRRVGANEVANIEVEAGTRLARRLVAPDVLDSVPMSADVSLTEVYLPPYFVDKTPGELDIEKKLRLKVVALLRPQVDLDDTGNPVRRDELIFIAPDTTFKEGDRLFLLGRNADLDEFRNL